MPYFAENGYDVYALSLRGHGNSPGDVQWASLNDYLTDIVDVVNDLGGPHPILIGHSMGGFLTQHYLKMYSEHVPAAVLLASIPINGTLPFTLRMIAKYPRMMIETGLSLDSSHMIATPALARDHFFSPNFPTDELHEYHAQMVRESFRIILDSSLFALPPARRYPTPMLVLSAINDALFTRSEQRQTARVYGKTAEFFNMAHDMMLEPGWIPVADRIVRWLNDHEL